VDQSPGITPQGHYSHNNGILCVWATLYTLSFYSVSA